MQCNHKIWSETCFKYENTTDIEVDIFQDGRKILINTSNELQCPSELHDA